MNHYYVYALIDPTTNVPFYVGKGKGQRKYEHTRPAYLKHHNRKSAKIKSLLSQGLRPRIETWHEMLTEEEAFIHEINYIACYGRLDKGTGVLCNHTDGGEGGSGSKGKGVPKSDEARKNMSNARKTSTIAKTCTLRNVKKMIANNTGKKRPKHSAWMKENNLRHQKVLREPPIIWTNRTGEVFHGNRWSLCQHDTTTDVIGLGCVLQGRYASYRGWKVQRPTMFPNT